MRLFAIIVEVIGKKSHVFFLSTQIPQNPIASTKSVRNQPAIVDRESYAFIGNAIVDMLVIID